MSDDAAPASLEMISVDELAAETGISSGYWDKLRCLGTGPAYLKLSKRVVRYRRVEVDRWLSERARTATRDVLVAA